MAQVTTIGELIKELQKQDATEPVVAIALTRFSFERASDIRNLASQAEFAQIIEEMDYPDDYIDNLWSYLNSATRDIIEEND